MDLTKLEKAVDEKQKRKRLAEGRWEVRDSGDGWTLSLATQKGMWAFQVMTRKGPVKNSGMKFRSEQDALSAGIDYLKAHQNEFSSMAKGEKPTKVETRELPHDGKISEDKSHKVPEGHQRPDASPTGDYDGKHPDQLAYEDHQEKQKLMKLVGSHVDEALWDKAKKASQEAFGKVKWPFVQWWYQNKGGGK